MAFRVINSDSEDEDDVPMRKNKPARNNQVIESSDESCNPDIDSFSSSDVYSEPESNPNESFSPLQVTRKQRRARQKAILTDDEEEDPSYAPSNEAKEAISNKGNAIESREESKSEVEDNSSESVNSIITTNGGELGGTEEDNSLEGTGKEREDDNKENNKENTSPSSHKLPPEKPLFVPMLASSQATSMIQPLVVSAKRPPPAVTHTQAPNSTFSLAHTRPALLKQLEYVKVRDCL